MLKPSKLVKNDVIGIVAPAGYVKSDELNRGVSFLEGLGFRVKIGRNLYNQKGYLAGEDFQRADDLMTMFADPEVKAIICARGGYGSVRTMPYLDFDIIKQNPKIFIGFSDITLLHLALQRYTEMVTFHGPMLISNFARKTIPYTIDNFRDFFLAEESTPRFENSVGNELLTIYPGKAEGKLVGGCLSIVVSTIGTQYEIETEGKILFLEDVAEEPYRIDRMLTQLDHSGKLSKIKGLIFGEMIACKAEEADNSLEIIDIIKEKIQKYRIPTIYGLASGHGEENIVLPFGITIRMDTAENSLVAAESVFREDK